MIKIKHGIFLLVLMLFPVNIYAYELTCDKSNVNYDENFFCYLTDESGISFKELSGNIMSTNDLIDCTPISFSNGLDIVKSEKSFAYSGEPTEEKLISFSCKLTKQLSNIEKTQIRIENFKYDTLGLAPSGDNEILSTDFINANIYNGDEEIDDLPRNTSNPDSLLKEISEENLKFVFSRFVTIYNQEVLYEVDYLNLNAVANNPSATIRIEGNGIENNTRLNIGKNVINIFVTSPDGASTTCYTLNVTRLARGQNIYYPEKDATLYSLIVPGYAISFDKDTYKYHIHLANNVSNLTVNAVPTYDESKVDISPTTNLKNNSIIKVTVTSKDKSNTIEYTIRITKDPPKVNYIPYIIMGAAGILLIVMVVVFIKTSKTKKSGGPTVIPDIDINQNSAATNQNLIVNNQTTENFNKTVLNNIMPQNNDQLINNQVKSETSVSGQVNQVIPENQVNNTNSMINQNIISNSYTDQNNISKENNQ